jgi:hypothetical protein
MLQVRAAGDDPADDCASTASSKRMIFDAELT